MFLALFILGFPCQAMTLSESVDHALKHNPSVVSQAKKADAARARLSQAMGAFLPTLKIEGVYGSSYTQPQTVQISAPTTLGAVTQTFSFGTDAVDTQKSYTASISQPIFIAGLFPGYQIARKSYELANEDLRRSKIDISFNASQAYHGVLLAGKVKKLSEESRDIALSHYNKVRSMLMYGAAARSDLLRAEVQLLNSEVALTKAKSGLKTAENAFNNVIGRGLDEEVALPDGQLNIPQNIPDYNALKQTAFESRPELIQFKLGKEIGEENVRVAQTAYLPTVMLSGQAGNRIVEYPAYKSDVNSWTILGVASWTLFDGFGIQNRIREAQANLDAQKATEDQIKNGIALEVSDALNNLKSAVETIDSSGKAFESAQENHKVSNQIFNSGAATNLEVIAAQATLTQAKLSYGQSVFDLEIARAKLNKAVGKEII